MIFATRKILQYNIYINHLFLFIYIPFFNCKEVISIFASFEEYDINFLGLKITFVENNVESVLCPVFNKTFILRLLSDGPVVDSAGEWFY